MLRFESGKSYVWLFGVFLVLFFGGIAVCEAVGHFQWGVITLPAFGAFLLVWELRSGVALDSMWRASRPRGSEDYWVILVLQAMWVVFASALSYVAIHR